MSGNWDEPQGRLALGVPVRIVDDSGSGRDAGRALPASNDDANDGPPCAGRRLRL